MESIISFRTKVEYYWGKKESIRMESIYYISVHDPTLLRAILLRNLYWNFEKNISVILSGGSKAFNSAGLTGRTMLFTNAFGRHQG